LNKASAALAKYLVAIINKGSATWLLRQLTSIRYRPRTLTASSESSGIRTTVFSKCMHFTSWCKHKEWLPSVHQG